MRRQRDVGRGRMLEVADVGVSFGAVRALDQVSLEVFDAEFVGIIGPNGAGKTTLFNVISGFVRPDCGRIRFGGRRVTDLSATARARLGVGRTFQNVGLQRYATVEENLLTAQQVMSTGKEFMAFLTPGGHAGSADERAEVVELFGLPELLGEVVHELPTGLAKRVELACAVLRRPKLLLLDEPSSGVDPEETARLGEALKQLHQTRDLTIVMIEHDMSLAMSLCEFLYVLDFGSLLAQGTPDSVRNDNRVVEAYLGQEIA